MAASNFRTIIIQGEGEAISEALAGEAGIKPGMLLAVSGGSAIKHATADGTSQRFFALESPTANTAGTPSIEVAYSAGDTVYRYQPDSGDVIYSWFATGGTITAGVSPLVSNGDGTLKTITVGTATFVDAVVGYAEETVANVSGAAVRARIRIR